MYLTEFAYQAPSSVPEVIEQLRKYSLDAKLIAGGQSLIPILKLKMAAPTVLIDLRNVRELTAAPKLDGTRLVVGAMTTYAQLLVDPVVAEHAPLLCAAVRTVADRQVRRLGTIGGSCSHADPAGDVPAVLAALEAEFVVHGPSGRRVLPADDFFLGFMEPALGPEDVLVEIRIPSTAGWQASYHKESRTAQAWATAAVGVAVKSSGGRIEQARIGMCNLGMTPLRARDAEQRLVGMEPSPELIAAVAADVVSIAEPTSDVFGSAEYRLQLAKVLTERSFTEAIGSAA